MTLVACRQKLDMICMCNQVKFTILTGLPLVLELVQPMAKFCCIMMFGRVQYYYQERDWPYDTPDIIQHCGNKFLSQVR